MRMYNLSGDPIFRYKSTIYIAKKLPPTKDAYMNEIEVYDEPKKFFFNVQPVNAESEGREFGQIVSKMKVAVVSKTRYVGKFKEYDKVYIDTTPEGESEYGENADYRIYGIRPQNACIRIYFLKLV